MDALASGFLSAALSHATADTDRAATTAVIASAFFLRITLSNLHRWVKR